MLSLTEVSLVLFSYLLNTVMQAALLSLIRFSCCSANVWRDSARIQKGHRRRVYYRNLLVCLTFLRLLRNDLSRMGTLIRTCFLHVASECAFSEGMSLWQPCVFADITRFSMSVRVAVIAILFALF